MATPRRSPEPGVGRPAIRDGQGSDAESRTADVFSPRCIRHRIGLSQTEFARTLRIPVATLRNWEQQRVAMDPATIALMTILAREPEAALRALRGRAA